MRNTKYLLKRVGRTMASAPVSSTKKRVRKGRDEDRATVVRFLKTFSERTRLEDVETGGLRACIDRFDSHQALMI